MIKRLAQHRKAIAILLFGIFYGDLAYSLTLYKEPVSIIRRQYGAAIEMPLYKPAIAESKQTAFAIAENSIKAEKADKVERADIGGPGQPEMSSFQSVNSSNMVDLFTGDFSYNLPLLDVGGYPVNIHYGSGISMDQEASWVGLGWNINPGTISRSMRGLPDDFNGSDSITRTQSMNENRTVGVAVGADFEIKGLRKLGAGFNGRFGIFYNNYNGWGQETSLNTSINAGSNAKGPLSGSLGISNNSQTGLDISPSLSMRIGKEDAVINGKTTIGSNYNSRAGISGLQLHLEVRGNINNAKMNPNGGLGLNSYISFATPSYTPTITTPITNSQYAFTAKLGGVAYTFFTNVFVEGYVSTQNIAKKDQIQKLPAYGYLYYSKAKQTKVLLDFNREKDIAFNEKSSPHIAIPQYTYDAFNISGEGTGGMFRPYRGDVGYIYDHAVKSNSDNKKASGDFGAGGLWHGGTDFSNTTATTESGGWKSQNELLPNIGFSEADSTYEEVYFRNPGEKSINDAAFYQRLGGDSLIRVKLDGEKTGIKAVSAFTKFSQAKPAGTINVTSPLRKVQRDKRSQVISYFTATDATIHGLEKELHSYKENINPVLSCDTAYTIIKRVDEEKRVRKGHHLSEIDVLNADGRRYVYGLPVYNVEQQDVTFAVDRETESDDLDKGMVEYTEGEDNRVRENKKGKDHYYNKEETPAYAHSFLLTGLLSPDYVDVKGDGITEDDLGDGVKFNYTEVYGKHNGYYSWRTPFEENRANYNEGLKTYSRDDKGTYMYGKKEVWYMNSIESKTMVALFKISDRDDAMAVKGENGKLDTLRKLKQLDSIQLYVKADLVKNGTAARPVKVVHFEYCYDLCLNSRGPGTGGKLTLKRIWFTYNGNNKGKLNPYVFYYNPDGTPGNKPRAATNPSYNPKKYDRWGNYKNPASNPGNLNNIDYPYAEQRKDSADVYAAAWELTDIKLPSGGRMHVEYEADDYAYVQNKRAAQFFKIKSFNTSPTYSANDTLLYKTPANANDCRYVFVDASSSPVTSKADIYRKYLEGIEKIYFKVAVIMPEDRWGSGYELVPTYGEIEQYDTVAGNHNVFYIKLKSVDGESPITKAALQFLRLNLPSKAYPASELGDEVSVTGAVKVLLSGFTEIKNSVLGFNTNAKQHTWCKKARKDKSFIRLNSPDYKKLGGGLRVKRVEVYDNWNKMTIRDGSSGLKESVYGQSYQYTTSKEVNGSKITISSGVAAYEPMIGGEENAFRVPIEYLEKVAPLAPANYSYTETPLGESFFPSAMVGYSKVRVRTINAKAKSANGWEQTEFFTTKDFPTIAEFTPFDGDSKKRHNPALRNLLRIDAKHYLTLSQGFKVELNDMNGKMKSQASYPENDSINPLTYTANYYKVEVDGAYQQKLNNTVWAIDSANGHINTQSQMGKEVEVMMDMRQQVSTTFSASISPNIDLIPGFPPFIPFIPIPSKITLPQHEENRFRSVAVMKIIQRYGILDSVVVIDKGSMVSTKNMVYDGETGGVLLSRTNNEFNDPVYNFNFPAHWAYSGMGMAYQNINALFKNKNITGGVLTEPNGRAFPIEKFFESGDEVYVTQRPGESAPALESDCWVEPYTAPYLDVKLWVMDAAKGLENKQGLYFIDKEGKPYSGLNVDLRIIRSGKRNFTDVSVGGITSLASPVKIVEGQYRIVIDSNTRVINASAAVFKDLWKVENTLYQADSCTTTIDTGYVVNAYPVRSALLRNAIWRASSNRSVKPVQNVVTNNHHFTASVNQHEKSNDYKGGMGYMTRGIIKFDLSSIPSDANILSATLELHGYKYGTAWNGTYIVDHESEDMSGYTAAHHLRYEEQQKGNDAILSTVLDHWNDTSKYYDMGPPEWDIPIREGIARVAVPGEADASCTPKIDSRLINVASLISEQKVDTVLNQGIMIKLANEVRGPAHSELRTLSFCGATESSGTEKSAITCETCVPPMLNVMYSFSKDTCYKVCRSNINASATNPYRWGILGNWRMDRAYTYYHERKESDASIATTDIRKDGELKGFIPYWQFNSRKLLPAEDTMRWVWNSAISQYNRKGFEIENYDPLNRYNSGLYGYNQTLPIAVIQNSQHRENIFDGFEDYSYRAQNCDLACPTPRPIDFLKDNAAATVQNVYSHSGRYALAVNNGQAVLTMPVITDSINRLQPQVSMEVETSLFIDHYAVSGKGTGLSAIYSCWGGLGNPDTVTRKEGPIDITYVAVTDSFPGCHALEGTEKMYVASWAGKIQPLYNDSYTFHLNSGMTGASLSIIATDTIELISPSGAGGLRSSERVHLSAGQLYTIMINYPAFTKSTGFIQLSWSSKQQALEVVPAANLYPADMIPADSTGSLVRSPSDNCLAVYPTQPRNIIQSSFSPVEKTKLVVSAWVNANPANCVTAGSTPPVGEIKVSFNAGIPGTVITLQPTGVAIEGWQRYEGVVTVDSAATQMYLTLKSATGQTTYFDDVRVHPFNANMKSFVYDPVSLRLMAELDENNYATFYEYDDDGTLIRVKKETERGIKTIKESRSALFKSE